MSSSHTLPTPANLKSKKGGKIPIRSNLLSFLIGVSLTYLLLQPNGALPKCPVVATIKQQSQVEPCNCNTVLEAAMKNMSVASGSTAVSTKAARTSLSAKSKEKSFYAIGLKYGTDKVAGLGKLPNCLKNDKSCTRPSCVREECRPWGHWYHTMYQQRIGEYSLDTADPFQFLEIGFFNGRGYQTYREFFTDKAEVHSMEISCLPEGKQSEGKWPWGNFAKVNKNYQEYLDEDRLHCGDAFNVTYLDNIWQTKMNRPDAPPLKIVVDDGSHLAAHIAQSFFFWFPRIEPGGLLIIEDIQPITEANLFRTQFLPQIMSDLHYCGDPKQHADEPCFPLLQKMLHSIHCEMHICVFQRNQKPALPNLPLSDSVMPANTLNAAKCDAIGKPWGMATG